MLSSIFLNHYLWNKGDSLNKEFVQHLGGEIFLNPLQLTIGTNYYLVKNYVYFKGNEIEQSSKWQQIIAFNLVQHFRWRGFTLSSKIGYQLFDENYFHLPHLTLFETAAFDHTFVFSTGGRLYTRLGIDFKYYSRYFPDTYLPPLGVFTLSDINDSSITPAGNYPIFNVHLTFKVKNVSFYIKYGHLNAWWNTRSFSAAHYPLLPATLSYGINWNFYDW
jgi:hypothetical protein